jgi:hypothetical protein
MTLWESQYYSLSDLSLRYPLITSAISVAISSIVYIAVFLATLSAREGL